MSTWSRRSPEERSLLNPAFCSAFLWSAANSYALNSDSPMPLDLAFVVAALVLPRQMREGLPKTTTTSLPVWVADNPQLQSRLPGLARKLVPFTREGLIYGGVNGLLQVSSTGITAITEGRRGVLKVAGLSPEMGSCIQKATLVGKWLAGNGSSTMTMALLGVRP